MNFITRIYQEGQKISKIQLDVVAQNPSTQEAEAKDCLEFKLLLGYRVCPYMGVCMCVCLQVCMYMCVHMLEGAFVCLCVCTC